MKCAWQEFLSLLPPWLRQQMGKREQEGLQELRLRTNTPVELIVCGERRWLFRCAAPEDLSFCINTASRYSPWNASTAAQGYITAPGGHRIGLCGDVVTKGGAVCGIREPRSVCIRIARDISGIAARAAGETGSLLILGPPGWGKTTLLRDLIRSLSDRGQHIAVVDERGELFPPAGGFSPGKCTDVLTGCPKGQGIDMLLRTMTPQYIAVDEITAQEDCDALVGAGWCGVNLLATAHAGSVSDLLRREVYRPLVRNGLFSTALVMHRDKSWTAERMDI